MSVVAKHLLDEHDSGKRWALMYLRAALSYQNTPESDPDNRMRAACCFAAAAAIGIVFS